MKLFTKEIMEKLIRNGHLQEPVRGTPAEIDFEPVVKIFNPYGIGTWLLTEVDPDHPDIAFGLCDLGYPELGSVLISELEGYRLGAFPQLGLERDRHFTPRKTIGEYAREASRYGMIKA